MLKSQVKLLFGVLALVAAVNFTPVQAQEFQNSNDLLNPNGFLVKSELYVWNRFSDILDIVRCGIAFGPGIGAIFGGMMDILKYLLKPDGGAFFFGYTLSAMIAGVIYGSILYKKPLRIWRILLAEFLVKLFVNCGLNTLWLNMMNGKAFMAILPARALKNAIMLPIDTAILFFTLTLVTKILNTTEFRRFKRD